MTENPLNFVLLLFAIVAVTLPAALALSPDALELVARKMRARARALRASKSAYRVAYCQSITDDAMWDRERERMRSLVDSVE